MTCIECKKNKECEDGLCEICLLKNQGLPWMNKMKIHNLTQGELGYIEIDGNNFLTIAGKGTNGLLFKKEEVEKAEDRFRGMIELDS